MEFCSTQTCIQKSADEKSIVAVVQFYFRYLDDLLNVDHICFDQTIDKVYPKERHLEKAMSQLYFKAAFSDLNLSNHIENL